MKKLLFFIFVIFFVSKVNAQITIISPPPSTSFTFDDLWNINIVVSGQKSYKNCFLYLELNEKSKGKILNAKTSRFDLFAGTTFFNQANIATIKPFTIKYFSDITFRNTVESSGIFPAGDYYISIVLTGSEVNNNENLKPEELTSITFTQNTELFFPPQLIYVYDNDTIAPSLNYSFMWTPPFPLTAETNVSYDIKFCEIKANQSPFAAINNNSTFYELKNHPSTIMAFPTDIKPFEKYKKYAWQVKANVGGKTAMSEIWSFVVDEKTKVSTSPYFAVPADDLDAGFYPMTGNYFYFQYLEKYHQSTSLRYQVINMNNSIVSTGTITQYPSTSTIIRFGDNRFALNLPGLQNGYYLLKIFDAANHCKQLRFKK